MSETIELHHHSDIGLKPFGRFIGWLMPSLLVSFLITNFLNSSYGWPSVGKVFLGGGFLSLLLLIIWGIGFIIPMIITKRRYKNSLRPDAKVISDFNAYLIRAAFFSVLFIGLADLVISFMKVENLLKPLFGEMLTKKLGVASFRGEWVHFPLIILGFVIATRTRTLGFHWLGLLIVFAELSIVISRFVFSYEQAFMGDLVRFWYAALFLFASAYTLLVDGHVRVDVFYSNFSKKRKAALNTIGTILFGFSLCWVILYFGMAGKQSIIYSPLANFEISQTGSGLYVKYLMAGFLATFACTMLIQFSSYAMDQIADYLEEPDLIDLSSEQ